MNSRSLLTHLFNYTIPYQYNKCSTLYLNKQQFHLLTINRQSVDDPIAHQVFRDIEHHLTEEEQITLKAEINSFIRAHQLEIDEETKELAILKAMATYATSNAHYGPVVQDWAHSLLDTALADNRKLIFLARDGIAPFLAAKAIKAAHPSKYHTVELYLLYISRTLAYSSTLRDEKISSSDALVYNYLKTVRKRDPMLLQKYILQETGMKENDRCVFVDVGFGGSVIQPIKEQLEPLNIDVRFNFLISHTTKAKVGDRKFRARGFLAHREKRPLEVVDKAGGNPAIHWVEDTHQSVMDSPKILMVNDSGRIVPGKVVIADGRYHLRELFGKVVQTCKHAPEEFLIKSFGLKGVLNAIHPEKLSVHDTPVAWKEASEELRTRFGSFLSTLQQRKRHLLLKH